MKKFIIFAISLLSVCALALTGCGGKTPKTIVNPIKTSDETDPEALKSNVVKVTCGSNGVTDVGRIINEGTGFFVDKGYLVTAAHIIGDQTDIKVTYEDGTETSATLVSSDPINDVALLAVETPKTDALRLSRPMLFLSVFTE